MSKINEIENAIIQIEGGRFQKMVDQYLYRKYKYDNIHSLGSQQGTDKTTKGVPDSYSLREDGKYIAIMYGTYSGQAASFSKVKKDLEDCIDRFKKDNLFDNLFEIVCCHTGSNFTIEQDKELHNLFNNVRVIGINTLANDLYYHYPQLAEEFLSVSIDTRQILTPEDFITENNRSVFGTPIDVEFLGRETEMQELSDLLLSNDAVVVEGSSGIGKTKLTYECCKSFAEKNEYIFYIIKNKNLSIYNDIKTYFSENQKYIIMVDDANQLTDLQFVLELIKENCDLKCFKIIVTVRDYAKNQTILKIKDFVLPVEYHLKPLEDFVIRDIITKNLGINNSVFLEQISHIAKGNVRLAFMAGISAKKDGYYANIQNASEIFKNYFNYILKDLNDVERTVMAIIAFIESFEVKNTDSLVYRLAELVDVSQNEIKEICKKLHELVIVDIYEELAVKFSDQNLRDFIIYYVFFEKKTIPIENVVELTFPAIQEKIIFHLSTTLRLFYSESIFNYLKAAIIHIWARINSNTDLSYKYAKAFHVFIENEVLLFIKNEIDSINEEPTIMMNYNKSNSNNNDPILEILSGYKDSKNIDSAIELLIRYLEKRNCDPDIIGGILIEELGIDLNSNKSDYKNEYIILELIYKNYINKPNDITAALCMIYAAGCLNFSFQTTQSGYNLRTINLIRFSIPNSKGIKKLHQKAFEILLDFYKNKTYKSFAYKLLLSYSPFDGYGKNDSTDLIPIIENDSLILEKELNGYIDTSNIIDCKLLHHFYRCFKKQRANVSEFFSLWENNENYCLLKLMQKDSFHNDHNRQKELDNKILSKVKERVYSMSISEIEEFFTDISKIGVERDWIFYSRLSSVVCDCEKDNLLDFVDLLLKYFPNTFHLSRIIERLISDYGYTNTFDFFNSYDTSQIINWFNELINKIPDECIDDKYCRMVIEGIRCDSSLYRLRFETIVRINLIFPFFITEYVNSMLEVYNNGLESKQIASDFLSNAIDYNESNINMLIGLFESVDVLKKLYIIASKEKRYFDYENKLFSALIKKDISIIDDLLSVYCNNSYLSDNTLDHIGVLWTFENYISILTYTFNRVIEICSRNYLTDICLKGIFESDKRSDDKVIKLVYSLIDTYQDDKNKLKHLLRATEVLSKEQRFSITQYICKKNKSIEVFRLCPIGPLPNHAWSGSEVPIIERRIKEYEEIADLLKGVDFIAHRAFCNDCVNELRNSIKYVLSREFIYDF